MLEDSEQATQLDSLYFKGFLRHGEASVELGKKPSSKSVDLIVQGIESLRISQSLVWKLAKGKPGYDHKAMFEMEIANQILRAKKIKWMKEQQLKKEEYE